jgi:hypothetical protein
MWCLIERLREQVTRVPSLVFPAISFACLPVPCPYTQPFTRRTATKEWENITQDCLPIADHIAELPTGVLERLVSLLMPHSIIMLQREGDICLSGKL